MDTPEGAASGGTASTAGTGAAACTVGAWGAFGPGTTVLTTHSCTPVPGTAAAAPASASTSTAARASVRRASA